ncbi:cyclin-P3-1-like [Triticum dicoccoides]|uniref:cyclin-P3-1-like n=1 Tax=Triticum dicoccoides TaxID=85692 RepID=UPI00188F4EBF|nr:cyclin-P3-1-like [Triticum dicoccoides]
MKESSTIFHGQRVTDLSIQLYVFHILCHKHDALQCTSNVYMTPFSVHRLLITSVAVAAKFTDDAFFNNTFYARVGGINTIEMNRLELHLLFNLDFRLKVNLETFLGATACNWRNMHRCHQRDCRFRFIVSNDLKI